MSINGRSFVVFRRAVEKKTVVSFRVLSSFETILRASSSESSSESSESSPTGSGLRDNVLCQNVVTFFMSKRKRKSRITFNLGYQKKKNILLVFPRCERKLQKNTPKQPHTHAHTTHVCRHQHQQNDDDESLLVDEKTPPKALVFETTTPFFCVRIVVFKIDAKTTGKGRP